MSNVAAQLHRRSIGHAIAAVGGLLVTGLVLWQALGNTGELEHAAGLLSHPAAGWAFLALVLELVSYLAFASGQRRLALAAGRRLGIRWLASLSVAAQALNNFLPAGYVAANVLNFKELRDRRLSAPATAWLLTVSSGMYIGTVAALTVIGCELAGGAGTAAADVRTGAIALLGALATLAVTLRALRSRRGRKEAGSPEQVVRTRNARWRERLAEVRISRSGLLLVLALFTACWLADASCLAASLLAVGAKPEWSSLLLAYSAAQLVSFLPITPGGVGLVEGTLAAGMLAGGAGGTRILGGVLLYRLFSYWGTLPAGAAGYLVLRHGRRARGRVVDGAPLGSSDGQDRQPPAPDRTPGDAQPVVLLSG